MVPHGNEKGRARVNLPNYVLLRLIPGVALLLLAATRAPAVDWVRAGLTTNLPVWGIRGGLQFALHPWAFREGASGPRGLIRIGSPLRDSSGCRLINFIAVEPIVNSARGFSELEPSGLDHVPGKRFWTDVEPSGSSDQWHPGKLSRLGRGLEELEVIVRVERFDNGAHVFLKLTQRSDQPDELRLAVHPESDSAPIQYCVLSATMGNFARTRRLWLKDRVVSSLELYPDYRGTNFTRHTRFPQSALQRTRNGEFLVAITTDETNPAAIRPFPGTDRWYYDGVEVTQYWKCRPLRRRAPLEAVVNGRFTYWASAQPIPGGVAFENFELQEPFQPGRQFIFGITRQTPHQLGFCANPPAAQAEMRP